MNSSRSSSSDASKSALRHVVDPEQTGARLDKVLAGLSGVASREMAQRFIRQGAVLLNGQPAKSNTHVQAGDVVTYRIPPPEPYEVMAEPGPLDILYEDPWILVLNKPPGLPMHPGPGHRTGTLVNYLLAHCTDLSGIGGLLRPGIVHRLDKDTSGVVVVAKNDAAHVALAAQFKAHTTQRTYLAIVVGRPLAKKGVIDLPLARLRDNRFKRAVVTDGKRAITHWQIVHRLGPFTLLRLRLETGRTHQIRVHLAHQGWPVLGDPLYGRSRHRGLNLRPQVSQHLDAFRRQALHAAELGFTHPHTGEPMHFHTPLPADMQALVDLLVSEWEDATP